MQKNMKIGIVLSFSILIALLLQYFFYPNSFPFNKLPEKSERNIVVIGGGLAGMSAAITASKNEKCNIFLFEKETRLGGNSAKATSGINGIFTEAQKSEGIEDSYDLFIKDTLVSGQGSSVESLVEVLVKRSTSAVNFLESFEVDLMTLSQTGGHSTKRTHRSDPNLVRRNVGGEIIFRLIEGTKGISNIQIFLGSRVVSIKKAGKKYVVYYEQIEGPKDASIIADGIIFTSGGFASDQEGLIKQYRPEISSYPTTNGPSSKGEGLKLLEELGAKIVDMNEIQVHPTGFLNPKDPDAMKVFLAPEALRGGGALLLKSPGKRFVDELQLRDHVSAEINENCDDMFNVNRKVSYLLLNEESADSFGLSKLKFYASKGLVREYRSANEMCEAEDGLEYEDIRNTFLQYKNDLDKGKDNFGKKTFPVEFKISDKLFLMYVTPSLHYTMGGARINERAQVLDKNFEPIPNIYAAGEVTGGVHGKNRLAGNSLLECVVFGIVAGEESSK